MPVIPAIKKLRQRVTTWPTSELAHIANPSLKKPEKNIHTDLVYVQHWDAEVKRFFKLRNLKPA